MKGRGLSFVEGRFEWHAKVATADEVAAARLELGLEPAEAPTEAPVGARADGPEAPVEGARR